MRVSEVEIDSSVCGVEKKPVNCRLSGSMRRSMPPLSRMNQMMRGLAGSVRSQISHTIAFLMALPSFSDDFVQEPPAGGDLAADSSVHLSRDSILPAATILSNSGVPENSLTISSLVKRCRKASHFLSTDWRTGSHR